MHPSIQFCGIFLLFFCFSSPLFLPSETLTIGIWLCLFKNHKNSETVPRDSFGRIGTLVVDKVKQKTGERRHPTVFSPRQALWCHSLTIIFNISAGAFFLFGQMLYIFSWLSCGKFGSTILDILIFSFFFERKWNSILIVLFLKYWQLSWLIKKPPHNSKSHVFVGHQIAACTLEWFCLRDLVGTMCEWSSYLHLRKTWLPRNIST